MYLMMMRTTKVMIGVSTIMKRVSFQLMSHKNMRLPKNCKKLRMIIDKLSEQTEYTVVISFPSLDRSYPDLVLS